MSVDRSLKVKSGLLKQRNVWTRAERIVVLKRNQKWSEGDPVLGIPKVRTRYKQKAKKK
jgi:small basic protein (TIGR04137 family)